MSWQDFSIKYGGALGALIVSWVLIFQRTGLPSTQKFFMSGQALGIGLVTVVLVALASLFSAKLRPYALVAGIYVAALAGFGMQLGIVKLGSGGAVATASESYVSNKYVTDWMSRSRLICADRDTQSHLCGSVTQVASVGNTSVDVVAFGYGAGVKMTWPIRYSTTSRGLCFTMPRQSDFNISVFAASNNVARIEAGDQLAVLTQDIRAELSRLVYGAMGAQAGDELCSRYSVNDREGDAVISLKEHVWKNGSPATDLSGTILHFYNEDAQLGLVANE